MNKVFCVRSDMGNTIKVLKVFHKKIDAKNYITSNKDKGNYLWIEESFLK